MPDNDVPIEFKADVDKALTAIEKILNSSDEQFYSRRFMLERVKEVGIIGVPWPVFSPFGECMNASLFGLIQIPTEFADYLMLLATLPVLSAVEIGVMSGASSYLAAAVLQRKNRKSVYHMVDINENIIVGFSQFNRHLNIVKHAPKTSDDLAGMDFDLVFIDADHAYAAVHKDFLNVGRHAKVAVAFHDIHGHEYDHLDGGPVRFWAEFRSSYADSMQILEFSHLPNGPMGMGVGIVAR